MGGGRRYAGPGEGITIAAGIGIEAVLTLVLIMAVFGTAIDPRRRSAGWPSAWQWRRTS